METRLALPIHPVPPAMRSDGRVLRIEGLVVQPLILDQELLAALPRITLEEPFTCEEGWSVPGLHWSGVRLDDILRHSQPLPSARYVRVAAESYVLPLPLADAELAVLCDELNGQPLEVQHGAPWRLVVPGAAYYASVKWVERLLVAADPGDNTAQSIARGRLRG